MATRKGLLLMCAVVTLSACACSKSQAKKTYPVTGVVLSGSKPVANAMVILHPLGGDGFAEGVKPRATTKADGSFAITTYGTDDGAPAGEYAVTVEQWLAGQRPDDGPSNRLDPKFAKPETSGFTASVATAATELKPIQLKR